MRKLADFDPNAGRSQEGGGDDRVSAKELVGPPLLIKVNKHSKGIKTKFGEKDAIDIDVCGIISGRIAADVRWFNGAVVDALAPYVGQVVPVKLGWAQGSGPHPYIAAEALSEIELAAAQKFLDDKNPFAQDQAGPSAAAPEPGPVPAGPEAPRW